MVALQKLILIAFGLVSVVACRGLHSSPLAAHVGVDLTTMIVIPQGTMETSSTSRAVWEADVREQLGFLVGQFRALGGIVDLSRLQVDVGDLGKPRLGRPTLSYAAQVPVKWQGSVTVPKMGSVILPRRGDVAGRNSFYSRFASSCRLEVSGSSQYWYNFAFGMQTCELSEEFYDKTLVVVQPYMMTSGSQVGLDKRPHVDAMWADHVLSVTSIFEYEFSREGRLAAKILSRLQEVYGEPEVGTMDGGSTYKFALAGGKAILWQVFSHSDADASAIKKAVHTSDVVFDTNSEGLMGLFDRMKALGLGPKTKLLVTTGAGSFAYVDQRVLGVSGYAASLDVIAQAVPAFKAPHSETHLAVLAALVAGDRPYGDLVLELGRQLPTAIAGLEDNAETQPANEMDLSFGFF